MLVLLDIVVTPELKCEGIAREIVNHVQMLRKTAELDPSDPVIVFYKLPLPNTDHNNKTESSSMFIL
jgi:isoleucyl-tRNA synthetase